MTLYDFLQMISGNYFIRLYAERTGTKIGDYEWSSEIPDRYQDEEVTDVFPDLYDKDTPIPVLGIEIAIDPNTDYDLQILSC